MDFSLLIALVAMSIPVVAILSGVAKKVDRIEGKAAGAASQHDS